MYTYKIEKRPKKTYEIIVDIPWKDIEQEYDKAFTHIHAEFSTEGFRKGKVPKAIAQKHIKREDVYQHLIHDLVPQIYQEIVKKEQLKPIISPKIDLLKAKEKEDWQIKMGMAEIPTVELGNYKDIVKKARQDAKKTDLWVPGKGQEQPQEEDKAKQDQQVLNASLSALLQAVQVEIPEMIIEEELNTRLTQTLDDIQKIGLTAEGYLKSKGTTMDALKQRLSREIEETYRLEFILMAIADAEKITVEQADLDKLFASISDPKEKEAARQNAYFYATILRKQRVLEFLNSL